MEISLHTHSIGQSCLCPVLLIFSGRLTVIIPCCCILLMRSVSSVFCFCVSVGHHADQDRPAAADPRPAGPQWGVRRRQRDLLLSPAPGRDGERARGSGAAGGADGAACHQLREGLHLELLRGGC